MIEINLDNISVEYPIYNTRNGSLRNKLINTATGGVIKNDGDEVVSITALKNISIHIKEGECVGLLGHNGSGKSTLLKTIAGIYPVSNGYLNVFGNIMNIFDIGAGFDYDLTGIDNIYQAGYLLGVNKKEINKRLESIINFSDLGSYIDMPLRIYSSGMVMRLMFSIATSFEPEILLMDEMFSVGDAAFQEKSNNKLADIIKSSRIVLIASHNKNYLERHCNRLITLSHGTIQEEIYL